MKPSLYFPFSSWWFFLLGVLLSFTACTEAGPVAPEQLTGRWTIKEALSNGRPTERMSSLYYQFNPDGSLLTNMTGADQTLAYTLTGDLIEQRGGAIDADYLIEDFQDSILVLSTQINNFSFRFTLRRSTEGQ